MTQHYAARKLAAILPILLSMRILALFDSISVQKNNKTEIEQIGEFGEVKTIKNSICG